MANYIDVVQLLIELDVEVPRIGRRLLVSPFTKLAGLHRVIEAAMGWDPDWPHHFILCGDIYKRVEPGEALDAKRERNWRLDSALYPDHYFFYATGPQYEWRLRITEEAYAGARQSGGIRDAAAAKEPARRAAANGSLLQVPIGGFGKRRRNVDAAAL